MAPHGTRHALLSLSIMVARANLSKGLAAQWLSELVRAYYPPHYVTHRLVTGEKINIDGKLDDTAWENVPFTSTDFVDLAEPRWPEYKVPRRNFSRVKVRWDDEFLYVGAELGEQYPTGSVTGHNSYLNSSRPTYGVVPYFDNDFEVFVDASMTNWYYKEFEMNFLNATYDVLWRSPDGGLGSVGVPCNQSSPKAWCQNTTFTATSQGGPSTWTMFNRTAASPGMQTATGKTKGGWTLEIKFPLRGTSEYGGLIDAEPGVDVLQYDPAYGAKYWWIDFSRAEHPWFNYWLTDLNSSADQLRPLCKAVQDVSPQLLGLDKYSCYWEWAWTAVGGHEYMHNPDTFGFLQFTGPSGGQLCRNVEWPVRFFLAQIYQAQVQYVIAVGTYTASLHDLMGGFPDSSLNRSQPFCTLQNGCFLDTLRLIERHPEDLELVLLPENDANHCVRYGPNRSTTGGKCFAARLTMIIPDKVEVIGSIRENRKMTMQPHASALCLEDMIAGSKVNNVYA